MTVTLDLSEDVATRLTALPPHDRDAFSDSALRDALDASEDDAVPLDEIVPLEPLLPGESPESYAERAAVAAKKAGVDPETARGIATGIAEFALGQSFSTEEVRASLKAALVDSVFTQIARK